LPSCFSVAIRGRPSVTGGHAPGYENFALSELFRLNLMTLGWSLASPDRAGNVKCLGLAVIFLFLFATD
ncbi:MAG: hypothetical protein LBL42_02135, partial [Tannerella sp.]|nr:hypothetical protein [Tannerella sp.]